MAIAIHNIPEGIAVSVPVYCATGSRRKAFWLSFMSGLSEPIGALLGYFVLRSVITSYSIHYTKLYEKLPTLGKIKVEGMSIPETELMLEERYSKYYQKPSYNFV